MHKSVLWLVCTFQFLTATVTTTEDQGRSECPNLFTKIGSKCYHFSTAETYTYDGARIFCQGLVDPVNGTADLAVLGFDFDDFHHVSNYMNQEGMPGYYWVGLTDPFNKGDWMWLDGTPMSLSSAMWACDEPRMCPSCLCTLIFRDLSYVYERIQLGAAGDCADTTRALCQFGASVKKGL